MGAPEQSVDGLIKRLPAQRQQEGRDFVEFLLERERGRPAGRPTFSWAGALRELVDPYTSVELQHQISAWRADRR